MGTKVAATTCLHWSQPVVSHSPSLSQTFSSSRRRTVSLFVRPLFGVKLPRSRSCEITKSRGQFLRRSCTASSESFPDEEFAKSFQELAAQRFHLSDEVEDNNTSSSSSSNSLEMSNLLYDTTRAEPPWHWPEGIERKANSVHLPLSLGILKPKKQGEEGFRESAYCSLKKAFSSMVFIIRELQTYTLHMRELLSYQDMQGILVRVQKEMHDSFVWLFQQIFSCTPTLMLYLMILLANFTVYSMTNITAIAAAVPPPGSYTETAAAAESQKQPKFDPLSVKTFSISGRTASVGGSGGGGGKVRPVAGGATDGGDGPIFADEMLLRVSSVGNPAVKEEEVTLWNSMEEEASRMQEVVLDHETMQRFVSPISAEMEAEDYTEYLRTELLYRQAVSEEPDNPLVLSNYAQFLYLVVHDHDRAEEYFRRAVRVESPDAESLSRYASFLWVARNDLAAAEETFLEAISADPNNDFHAANYAHFLWNTGAEDTCYPLTDADA